MASTAKPVVTVEETLMLSSGKRPVRINHRPSSIIPKFLPAKLFVSAIEMLLRYTESAVKSWSLMLPVL
jgi:hypothetical protein